VQGGSQSSNQANKVDKSTSCSCQILSGFKVPNNIKISYLRQSYSKNKKVDLGDSVLLLTLQQLQNSNKNC